MPGLLVDLAPLRASRVYRRLWVGTSLSSIGSNVTAVVVGLQVYDLTGSTVAVGLVGLFAVVPLVVLGLYAGSLVDAHDRRVVVIITSGGLFVAALVMTAQAWLELGSVGVLYGAVSVQSAFYAANSPARASIIPRLLPAGLLPAANALASLSMSVGMTAGPLLAAVLVRRWGYVGAYAVEAALLIIALSAVIALPSLPPIGPVRRAGFASVAEGLRYLRTQPVLGLTFLADLSAMVLALPRVLFPAIAATVVGGGAGTVGLMMAAIAVGSIAAGLFSGPLGRVRRQGLAVVVSVAGWGLAVAGFGLVLLGVTAPPADGSTHPALWPVLGLLAVAGACDAVSAVFRMTILQTATPDRFRGRLQGVFIVVVAGGPQLGALVLGSVAGFSGEAPAAVLGGIACLVAVLALAAAQPRFVRYDARAPSG